MRLTKFTIQNYRCIENCTIQIRDYLSLIGPNNAGKSTIIHALALFLNQGKPSIEEWRNGCEDQPIILEGLFEDLLDWERDSPGISGLVYDSKIHLRYIIEENEGKISGHHEAFKQDMIINGFSGRWAEVSDEIKNISREIGIDNGTKWRKGANQERVREAVVEKRPDLVTYSEPKWSDESISIGAALKQAIPDAVLVPAVRDAMDDTKTSTRTSFGQLLNRVVIPAIQTSDEYGELINAINILSSRLSGKEGEQLEPVRALATELSQSMSTVIETKVVITLATPETDKFLGSNAVIRLDDGVETSIAYQGHGVQRSLIFALIEFLARQNSILEASDTDIKQRAALLLFEEPELYMHPHMMRRLSSALQSISGRANWQVVISTHSPFLIDVADDPQSLVILQRNSSTPSPAILQLEGDPFSIEEQGRDERLALRASLDFHPTISEAFFAQRVVLVEGDSELALFQHSSQLLQLAGIDSDKASLTTIISCGGKWTIPAMARLLANFGIPFRIVHDMDRKGMSEEELAHISSIHPYKANQSIKEAAAGADIFVVEDTLEHIIWENEDFAPQKDKPYQAWLKAKSICEDCENLDSHPKLLALLSFVYDW